MVGVGTVPGTAADGLLLDPVTLEDSTPHDRMGGFGSGLTDTGIGTRYVAVPDRGPADGTISYRDRYYLLDIVVAPGAVAPVSVSLVKATPLTNESGATFTGSSSAFDATNSPASLRLDPEGIRVSGVASLPQTAPLPADITPVSKALFIDLLASDFGLAGSDFPEKIEGLAFGPDLADGRHLLLVTSDNDFVGTQDTRVLAFAIERGARPGFAPQILTPALQVRTGPNTSRINLKSRGTLPVVIPSGDLLDATGIDPAAIVFAGAGVEARRTPPGPDCRVRDADSDGLSDLVCHFETQDLDREPGDTTAPLTATTFSGTPVQATAVFEAAR